MSTYGWPHSELRTFVEDRDLKRIYLNRRLSRFKFWTVHEYAAHVHAADALGAVRRKPESFVAGWLKLIGGKA